MQPKIGGKRREINERKWIRERKKKIKRRGI